MAEETQPKPRGKTVLRREIPLASGSTPGKLMICSSCVEQYQVRPFLSQHLSSSLMWAIRHVATQGVCGIPRFLALCCGLVVMHAWESVCAHIWRERERESGESRGCVMATRFHSPPPMSCLWSMPVLWHNTPLSLVWGSLHECVESHKRPQRRDANF